ncbi:efflux RND transporter permease subunit [Rhodopirellula sp. MGV]|uniref:efflux RND transporter permease subunit n=1 Tax=Rhodopirellula sp. MGV TaxID=2023130 RepID=UPI000B96C96D|nr:efflux RND transporter permease subunit [Rhodopirellula sp. MGV]OYP34343.1 acriflavin resistance protein [Rhodopirellula sp. MGV]PNY35254.1 AcrB/AcrD/AcrF family protein [Rhodopirellula baltica]
MISFFAKHPTAANLLMLIMLAAGLLSIRGLRRETFPDAAPVVVQVMVPFPGATAEEVEETIVHRLESALEGVQYLKKMTARAQPSTATVQLEMNDGGDYQAFRNEIDNSISGITDFPDDAEAAVVTRLNTRQPVLDLLVSGPLDAVNLKRYCNDLKDKLLASPRVSEVTIAGFSDHLLRVELDREAMLRYDLSPTIVSNAIASQSLDLPAGKIDGEQSVLVRVQESRKSQRALEDLVISGVAGGAEIKLGDVATVKDEFELEEQKVTIAGQRGAILQVMKAKAQDTLQVAEAVNELLVTERALNPQMSLQITNNTSKLVRDRINLLLNNAWQGCVLVFLAMWLFFNVRLSFWVVASLPVSFLAAFAIVPHTGLTINMLTMVGLLMALGLLMDDGIVIAENIARRRDEGEPAMAAAVNGVAEVAGGVFSSFLTTCCVLGPLVFLNGQIGRMLSVLPMMLLLVLATSLVEAFLILPSHLGHSLAHDKSQQQRNRFRAFVEGLIDAARDAVGACVGWTVRWRYLTLGLTVMAFLLTIGLMAGGFVRGQVFPALEGDTIVARLLMPPGTPLERTSEVIAQFEKALQETNEELTPQQPDGQALIKTSFVRFGENSDANESGTHAATVQVDLLSVETRTARMDDVIRIWREKIGLIPDAAEITIDEAAIGPAGRDIHIELSGLEMETLDEISAELQNELLTFDGVYSISDDLRRGEAELLITLRSGAVGLNLTTRELAQQLRGSFQGLRSDQIQVGKEKYDIEVRFDDASRSSLSDLDDYLVTLPSGHRVPLSEVANVTRRRGWSSIVHIDGKRTVGVYASVDATRSNGMAVLQQLRRETLSRLVEQHPGLQYGFKGAAESGEETGTSMGIAGLIGCLGIYVILSFQFRSYIEPAIVMVAIPFAFVGVVWGHLLFRQDLSLPSVMGYASLAGIVVNDSILLMLFLKDCGARGTPVMEAAVDASRKRFRAVMITSLTTIAGLLPLMFETDLQAQVLIPIAISICFGLFASTTLVLLVIPAMYVLLADFGLAAKAEGATAH